MSHSWNVSTGKESNEERRLMDEFYRECRDAGHITARVNDIGYSGGPTLDGKLVWCGHRVLTTVCTRCQDILFKEWWRGDDVDEWDPPQYFRLDERAEYVNPFDEMEIPSNFFPGLGHCHV